MRCHNETHICLFYIEQWQFVASGFEHFFRSLSSMATDRLISNDGAMAYAVGAASQQRRNATGRIRGCRRYVQRSWIGGGVGCQLILAADSSVSGYGSTQVRWVDQSGTAQPSLDVRTNRLVMPDASRTATMVTAKKRRIFNFEHVQSGAVRRSSFCVLARLSNDLLMVFFGWRVVYTLLKWRQTEVFN